MQTAGPVCNAEGIARVSPPPTHRGVTRGAPSSDGRVLHLVVEQVRTGLVTDTAPCAPAPELVGKRPSVMTLSTG